MALEDHIWEKLEWVVVARIAAPCSSEVGTEPVSLGPQQYPLGDMLGFFVVDVLCAWPASWGCACVLVLPKG